MAAPVVPALTPAQESPYDFLVSKRYEDEIEEILDRTVGPRIVPIHSPGQRQNQGLSGLLVMYLVQRLQGLWALSPGRVMIAGALLIGVGFALRGADAGFAVPVTLAGVIVLVVGYALAVVRPMPSRAPGSASGPPPITPTGKTWRGRSVDPDPDPDDNWWTRQKRGPR